MEKEPVEPLKTVSYVDLCGYMGVRYEIARYPKINKDDSSIGENHEIKRVPG